MTTMRVVGECFFWYRLTRVFPDKFHKAVKRLCCVCVCVGELATDSSTDLNKGHDPGWVPFSPTELGLEGECGELFA